MIKYSIIIAMAATLSPVYGVDTYKAPKFKLPQTPKAVRPHKEEWESPVYQVEENEQSEERRGPSSSPKNKLEKPKPWKFQNHLGPAKKE